MDNIKLGNKEIFIGLGIVTLLYLIVLFKLQGLLFFLAISLIFMTPTCIIIHKLGFNLAERLFFSLFLGLGLFPSLVYYLALVLGSITLTSLIIWILLTGIGVFIYLKKKPAPSA